jgi:tRNA threonylcarbamoyladenosine biosynthesis protein TsaE
MKNRPHNITVPIDFTLDEIDEVVEELVKVMQKCRVITFSGNLGAGKTTLVKALLKKLGVRDIVTSPTFTYVNVYKMSDGATYYHFDLYRISTLAEFVHAGFDEYLYAPNSWCFIEWPEVIKPLLTHDVCFVELSYIDEDTRTAMISCQRA